MKHRISYFKITVIIVGMTVLVLDSKTALLGSSQGLALCIRTIIPSLLPFFVLTSMLTGHLCGYSNPFLAPIGKLCSIPKGHEAMMLVGWLGGYPVGAQNIYQAYASGAISKADAGRMLGFCNNAGPSFIFGITAAFFTEAHIPWILWAVHIVSSLAVGFLLPTAPRSTTGTFHSQTPTLQQALKHSLKALSTVCGWVVLMRVVIAFLQRWLLWLLPDAAAVLITGILELANGCCALSEVESEPMRFLICNVLLSFGGICVWMQTISVTHELGTGSYILGKILQTLISIVLSFILLPFIFSNEGYNILPALSFLLVSVTAFLFIYLRNRKKEVAFSAKSVYNSLKSS